MMRIAAIYDVHGNAPALKAVLADVDRLGVDLIVVGGDIAWGPFPRATVEILIELADRATFIRGNADREVGADRADSPGEDATWDAVTSWTADQLSTAQLEWLAALPEHFRAAVEGLGDVLFCHGSPRSDEESLTPLTPEDRLARAAAGVREKTIVCGHTHMQFERRAGDLRVVNAGSVGLPYEKKPGAYWALLDETIDLRRTEYDIRAAVAAMAATSCPNVQEVFIDTLLQPPPIDEAARHFEQAAAQKGY